MKVYAVMVIARQVEGEYVFVRSEKAFTETSKAEAHLKSLKATFSTPAGKVKPIMINTPQGQAECFCEAGVFELDVDN